MDWKKRISWKRALVAAVAFWVLVFFEVSILMFGFKLSATSANYYLIHTLLLTVFLIVLSLTYFSKKIKKGVIEGIVLGVIFVIVGVILDSVLTIPLFIIPQGGSYSSFLFSGAMLSSYAWTIIICGIVGWLKGLKK